MFRIGEFSKLSGLSLDTLYHYEKMNILKPAQIDKFTGYRYYEASQLVTVNKIMALKDSGFTLGEVSAVLNKNLATPALIELLENKSTLMEEELDKELARLARLRTNIFLIKNGGIPQMNEVTIKKVEPILMATVGKEFHCSKFDEELEAMWQEVNEYIDLQGGKRSIPCMMLYHTHWEEMGEDAILQVEVAEPIVKSFEGSKNVKVYELPAVEKMACIVHKGPFTTISATVKTLYDWISQNGYTKKGPLREIYHKGDWVTNNPEEYVTELQIPIV